MLKKQTCEGTISARIHETGISAMFGADACVSLEEENGNLVLKINTDACQKNGIAVVQVDDAGHAIPEVATPYEEKIICIMDPLVDEDSQCHYCCMHCNEKTCPQRCPKSAEGYDSICATCINAIA